MKTALITGSTSGIGLGIAEAFAAKGYQIIFNGLEPDGAEIAASVAIRHQIEYQFSRANMLDPEALKQMVMEAEKQFGHIDVLVNNAGIQYVSPIENFPEEQWNKIIAINLSAPFLLCKAVWSGMKKNGRGRIINIASAHGLVASEFKSAYVAAKHGVIGLTKTLALEGAPFGITSNAICPGYVKTKLVDQQINDQAKAHGLNRQDVTEKIFLDRHAVKEFIPVDTIAAMALLLASDESATITGVSIPLDAGWLAR